MDFSECLDYLDRLGNEVLTMKFGLETTRVLLAALGDPHQDYPAILIAGTNGKGSVARFTSSVCRAAGIRTALFTSPHLVRLTERFQIDDSEISRDLFSRYFTQVVEMIEDLQLPVHPTFFEAITATALHFFSQEKVDLAVLEVGMGGRLDSTNVVDPVVSIITRIGLDHQQFLGHTLPEIAREKAGILRRRRPALSAPQRPQVRKALQEEALNKGTAIVEVAPDDVRILGSREGCYRFRYRDEDYRLSVPGAFQVYNAALAISAIDTLRGSGFRISSDAMRQGIHQTSFQGVIQVFRREPTVILDGGHNTDAAMALLDFLLAHTKGPRTLVFGSMQDKDISQVLRILTPQFERVYLTQFLSPRAASPDNLKGIYPQGEQFLDPLEAYQAALSSSETVVVSGSFHLLGEILGRLEPGV
jgi:dihydrofolate synthase/folylpolyglutamate synthase